MNAGSWWLILLRWRGEKDVGKAGAVGVVVRLGV